MKSPNITEPCLFCNNPAGSKEHLWGAWIHRRKAFGPIRVKVGTAPVTIFDDPERKIDTVCKPCNNGWMSGLEQKNIPTIGSMMQDLAIPLNKDQQNLLSSWAIKTAMVLDSVKNLESNPRFYEKSECVDLRVKQSIPARTRIWIARSSISSLGAYGTDLGISGPDSSKIGTGMVTTVVVGHFAVQILSTRPLPQNTTQRGIVTSRVGVVADDKVEGDRGFYVCLLGVRSRSKQVPALVRQVQKPRE